MAFEKVFGSLATSFDEGIRWALAQIGPIKLLWGNSSQVEFWRRICQLLGDTHDWPVRDTLKSLLVFDEKANRDAAIDVAKQVDVWVRNAVEPGDYLNERYPEVFMAIIQLGESWRDFGDAIRPKLINSPGVFLHRGKRDIDQS